MPQREAPIQRAIINYLRLALPGAVVAHVPNAIAIRGKDAAKATARAKREGMVPGFPDLICIHGGKTWLFEVKAPGGALSKSQKALHPLIEAQGVPVHVVKGVDQVEAILKRGAK